MSSAADLLKKESTIEVDPGWSYLNGPISNALQGILGLRYAEDLWTLFFCGLYFSVVTLQWAYEFQDPWVIRGLFVATAFLAFQGAVTVHNAVHCPIFKSSTMNKLFQVVISCWFGHCASTYVPGHNLSHHRNLQTRKDIMRTTKMKFRWNFLNGLLFMPTILLSTSANDANYFNAQKAMQRPIYYQLQLEATVYVLVQVVLAAINPMLWLRVLWVPHLIGKYGIISLNMLQHDGTDTSSKYNHSRNFVSPLLNFLCFNNGYHGIHHMYPGKHWSLLKLEHDKRVKPFMHPALDEPSIWGYMFRSFVFPGIRLDYLGKPVPIVADGPDEPWFYATTESYSDRDADKRVWDKSLNQYGPEDEIPSSYAGLARREAKSYTHIAPDTTIDNDLKKEK